MKNKTTKVIIILASALTIFTVCSFVGASGLDWMSQISVDAANTIDTAAKNKTNALTADIDTTIKEKVKVKINPEINTRKSQIEAELDAYFDQKASSVTDGPEYQNAVKDLDRIKGVLLDNYKSEIDKAFAGK